MRWAHERVMSHDATQRWAHERVMSHRIAYEVWLIHAMRHDSFMCPSLFSMPFRYATLCVYAMPPYVTHP